jgi:hypothetical protein
MWCIDQLNASSEYAMIIKYLSTATLVISGLLLGANVTQAQTTTTSAPTSSIGANGFQNSVIQANPQNSNSQTSSKMSPESQNIIDILLKSFLGKLF